MVSPIPSREREASKVVFFRRLRGMEPGARLPLGARAYKRVRAMLDPLSSRKTHLLGSSSLACSLHCRRSSSFLSLASNVFFPSGQRMRGSDYDRIGERLWSESKKE